jgi:CubicO group peptidase (beta-lactamase class C family)
MQGSPAAGRLSVPPLKCASQISASISVLSLRWHYAHWPDRSAGRSAGSLCWAGLFNTYFWIDPAKRVTGTIMTQVLPFADETVLRLYGDLERGVYAALQAA